MSLTEAIGSRVEVRYHGPGSGAYGGWHVEWCNGPTWPRMTALAAARADEFPAVGVPQLRYDRSSTDVSEAAALLAYLSARPGDRVHSSSMMLRDAFDACDYPERLDRDTLRRARALCVVDPDSRGMVTLRALRELAERCRTSDWMAVLAWLDEVGADVREAEPVTPAGRPALRVVESVLPDVPAAGEVERALATWRAGVGRGQRGDAVVELRALAAALEARTRGRLGAVRMDLDTPAKNMEVAAVLDIINARVRELGGEATT
jgi:hypothetical protein